MDLSVQEVRQALHCLYDGVALGGTTLASRLPEVAAEADPAARARRLRGLLLDAIEVLQPSRPAAFRSPATRSYQVLALHYLDGITMAQIASELHVSERQAYRDLARAEESLTELLAGHSWDGSAAEPAEQDALADELQRLPPQAARLSPAEEIRWAVQTVAPLARDWGIVVSGDITDHLPPVLGNQALLRQTLVQLLSAVIRNAHRRLTLSTTAGDAGVRLLLEIAAGGDLEEALADVRRLAAAQRAELRVAVEPTGDAAISLTLPFDARRVVLIVEDNRGSAELYRRYLATSGEWDAVEVPDPRLAFESARAICPVAIILDILMPQQDGWSVLQMLRAQPETEAIPVLVCSVFDELELAAALGATAYLKKPVSQFQLLTALRRCLGG